MIEFPQTSTPCYTATMADFTNQLAPIPVNLTIQHVDAKSSTEEHIDADSTILTATLLMLMQTYPNLTTLTEVMDLSDQVMKVLTKRRELCLKPTSKADIEDSDITISPVK